MGYESQEEFGKDLRSFADSVNLSPGTATLSNMLDALPYVTKDHNKFLGVLLGYALLDARKEVTDTVTIGDINELRN
jgi:hypothetical protein